MIVFLNKFSNYGQAGRKWEKVLPELESRGLAGDYTLIADMENLPASLSQGIASGQYVVVAAGGDGTVNFVLNALMSLTEEERKQLVLGAVGLGSSNDFHKPYSQSHLVNGRVFFKLDSVNTQPHNVGCIDFEDDQGRDHRRYFLINASVGIIAEANHLFNSGDSVINWMKPRYVLGAIYYAALKTILRAPNIPATIRVGEETLTTDITCLSILINPNFSGNLSYNLDVNGRSDYFGVVLCEKMGVGERVSVFYSIMKRKFQGGPKTRIWKTRQIEIQPLETVALEMDGEVYLARNIRIRLLQAALRVCS